MLIPLWLRGRSLNYVGVALRKEANIALFHERRDELEADYTAGDIDQPSYDALVLELQQGLLIDVSLDDDAKIGSDGKEKAKSNKPAFFKFAMLVPLLFTLSIPIAAYILYERWGFLDEVALTDLFERTIIFVGCS